MAEILNGQPSAASTEEHITTDEAATALNTTHRTSDGKSHSDVVSNNTHRASDGSDHSKVGANETSIALNTTHRGSDGKDHSDVVLNNTHRSSDGSDHSKVTANETAIALNTTHRSSDGSDHSQVVSNKQASLSFVIDGGGNAITTGIKGDLEVPFACAIQSVTLLADQTGSITIDIWKDTYANFPPTDADTITGGNEPAISAGIKDQDSTLSSWTTSLSKGDILRFNVDSVATIQRVTLSLKVNKT